MSSASTNLDHVSLAFLQSGHSVVDVRVSKSASDGLRNLHVASFVHISKDILLKSRNIDIDSKSCFLFPPQFRETSTQNNRMKLTKALFHSHTISCFRASYWNCIHVCPRFIFSTWGRSDCHAQGSQDSSSQQVPAALSVITFCGF